MIPRWLTFTAALLMLPASLAAGHPTAAGEDAEAKLLARLQAETNPVKKAKDEMRLGRLKLDQAMTAYERGNAETGAQLLTAFVQRMQSSWETLRASGRNGARQPQGFKELDIALREDDRLLADLAHRVTYFDRGPIEKASGELQKMRAEVLRALFPEAQGSPGRKHFLTSRDAGGPQ